MKNLISTLNSGESLEKAIVLFDVAMIHNRDFYQRFELVTACYCENLPKSRQLVGTHGTLEGLVVHLGHMDAVPYSRIEEFWDDRARIVSRLVSTGPVSYTHLTLPTKA